MKTSKEFLEGLKDEAFLAEFQAKVRELSDGSAPIGQTIVKAAEALGFSVSDEDVEAFMNQTKEISKEELEKVSGGSSWPAGTRKDNQELADLIC